MDLTYSLIAGALVVLPFLLTWLLSGSSGDTKRVLGAEPRTKHRPGPQSLQGRVKDLLVLRRKQEAIKLVQEKTGSPVAAATKMVADMEKSVAVASVSEVQQPEKSPAQRVSVMGAFKLLREIGPEVTRLVREGNKIGAIKLIRERTGMELEQAKAIVDRLS